MKIVKKQVESSKLEAEKDGVKVPETVEDYCIKSNPAKAPSDDIDMLEFDDNDYYDYGNSDEDDEYDEEQNDEDSGQGENWSEVRGMQLNSCFFCQSCTHYFVN